MPEINIPEMSEMAEAVKIYAPSILAWCAMAFVGILALRILLGLFGKRSHLLRTLDWAALIGGVAALGGYWMLTGEIPEIMHAVSCLLSDVDLEDIRARFGSAEAKGIIALAAGAVLTFFSGPLSRTFSRGSGAGDLEIVIKTVGWLTAILGALMVCGVL